MGLKILSLFDGMSCGMIAFRKIMESRGGQIDEYHAYEIDKYAIQTSKHNFPEIVHHGDVFEGDFTRFEGFDYLVGGSPCVPAGSKIKTDKGYKTIESIEIGDMVLTHKNRYKPVTRLYERKTNHLYHIKINGNYTLDITGNHPVYTYRNNEFQFVRTDELTTNDFVCVNINQKKIIPYSEYNSNILWLVGRALADGYLSKDKNAMVIAVGKNKTVEFEKHICGLKYYICHKDRPAVEYIIQDDRLKELYCYFGDKKALDKCIPDTIMNFSSIYLKEIFDGYISGDGFRRIDKPNTVMWCSSSEDLILSMGLLTAKLFGKYPTTTVRSGEYKKLPSGMCYTNPSYNSQISITDRKNANVQIVEDKLLLRIKEITKEEINTTVYNIETAEDHSYTVNNFIVHNCTYWSIAQSPDKRETTASGLGWELFSQYVRALNESKPKYFLYENNKSMSKDIYKSISDTFGFEPICINSALVSAQNRQRLYWVGKRNHDGTYSKVDIEQPKDRGILLRDILNGGQDLTSNNKCYTLTASCDGAVAWNTIERKQRNMVVEPVGITKGGKSYSMTSNYSYGSGENIGNYVAHTLTKGCKSMVAEPVNLTKDGKAQCIRATCYKDGIRNIVGNNVDKRTGVAEPVAIGAAQRGGYKPDGETEQHFETRDGNKANCVTTVQKDSMVCHQVGALPRPNGELSTSQAFRIYDINAKSVTLKAGGGGAGGKTGLYAIPIEYENDEPIKAVSISDNKTYTVYKVQDDKIEIKGKTYPIKLVDGYYIIRKLTVDECKKLQTVPNWFEFPVSDTQSYKQLGAGWTVDVIVHLLEATME